ncbi:DNA-binding transcriptional regulator, AcrR family [Amycolatopsis rubida]|uniref:DNA-binding transcriptional regulator, AcrR family n=2 Tax=Amycolatopsis rubida TaxID=112413 RepID=A0A1I5SGA1_9PSEU|nr:DNA-binding transcriptional regulator, AcrR family [Amycolatopsis rubida]
MILRVAERLFSERSIDAVSTREILKESGVNPAAIHYHFGSKPNLVEALLEARMSHLTERQDHWLRAVESAEAPEASEVIACFTRPITEIAHEPNGEFTVRFLAEAANHPGFMESYLAKSAAVFDRKLAAVSRITPGLTQDQRVAWTRFASTLAFRILGSRIYTSESGRHLPEIPKLEDQVAWFLRAAIPGGEA